ncbi:hypothetical protein CC80DRAFT_487790 [Byssothecium circinans]|uniref:Uncharacterized protein n=1 Tax=Byssothecium circinans TaxID=147558 RepID=A0A6A5UDA8_9PLEO|nr:hypothetical protein CC80DRAFT_487790 [Byssothecium circinans]
MTSLHTIALVPIIHGLKNAAAFLQKGLNHTTSTSTSPSALISARLHPDMYDLSYQICSFTVTSKSIPVRINPNIAPLTLPDVETTFPDLLARIKKTIEYLEAIKPEDINGREEVDVVFTVKGREGEPLEQRFTGLSYLLYFAHPNFWFHVTTAYGILRKEGVDLGKVDFMKGQAITKVEW